MKLKIALVMALISSPVLAWVSTTVPDFQGQFLTQGDFRLADHIGREMIVLNFFETYCAPCQEELPALNQFVREHASEPLRVIGIDSGEGLPTIKSFLARIKVDFPVLPDTGELQKKLGINGFPYTIVIGVDGKIQFQHLGVIDVTRDLGPLLKQNIDMLKTHRGIDKRDFLAAQEKAGQKTIHLKPPEVHAVAGYAPDSSKPNQIFSIRVVKDEPSKIEVEVDYYYSGDHGDQRIYVDCDPIIPGKGAPFGMLPIPVSVGRHTGRAPLTSYDGTPNGAESTQIDCDLSSRVDQAGLAKKSIAYRKIWRK